MVNTPIHSILSVFNIGGYLYLHLTDLIFLSSTSLEKTVFTTAFYRIRSMKLTDNTIS